MLQKSDLPDIPPHLIECAEHYEASPKRTKKGSSWPPYAQLYAWVQDRTMSFKHIGDLIGVSRERIRQVCNEEVPGVRHTSERRHCGRQSAAQKTPHLEPMDRRYHLLKMHAYRNGLHLEPRCSEGRLLRRSYLLQGRTAYVVHITSAFTHRGTKTYWAKCPIERRSVLRKHDLLIVVIKVEQKDVSWSAIYSAWTRDFLASKLTYVHIPYGKPHPGNRPRKFDWNSRRGLRQLGLLASN